MEQNEPIDVAREPVDLNEDAAFMDTGVLHEARPCIKCDEKAQKGRSTCANCKEGK